LQSLDELPPLGIIDGKDGAQLLASAREEQPGRSPDDEESAL
jgi:hypothetical protein